MYEWVIELRDSFSRHCNYSSPKIDPGVFESWWEVCWGSFDRGGFELLVLLGVDLDHVEFNGRSYLHRVGFWAVESLLEAGANPNLIDDEGRTALDQALLDFTASRTPEQITQLFREYGGKTAKELEEENNGSIT